MGVRLAAAVNAARLSGLASRLLGRGGGTALPGLVAAALHPDVIADLAQQLSAGSIVVSGTNGKTTTCRILAGMLEAGGYDPVRNESGSNLSRGLASSLIEVATVRGTIPSGRQRVGVFEVDEAALPGVLRDITPVCLTLLDLFRDQLDRYGEVATVSRLWKEATASLPESTTLAVNADDPLVTDVAESSRQAALTFGVESATGDQRQAEHASDVKTCPRCGGPIEYKSVFLGHLGHYSCASCSFTRPRPDVRAEHVRLRGLKGSAFDLALGEETGPVSFPLPGMYNVYNALAAAATAWSVGVPAPVIRASLAGATPAFGRMERVSVEDRSVYLALAKNPAGLNEVLRTVAETDAPIHLLMMLNDNIADGRDVSWIWDADIEMLTGRVATVVFGGRRAYDMALRFKYAGIVSAAEQPGWEVQTETREALDRAVGRTPPAETLFIVPTYTAMLEVRDELTRRGDTRPYWES